MTKLYLITGCSGGGKSTLLKALAEAGHAVVPEPGRRILRSRPPGDDTAAPWSDLEAFAHCAMALALSDINAVMAKSPAPTAAFFDRGVVDAATALAFATGAKPQDLLANAPRYAEPVFLAPPWRTLFRTDPERRHSFEDAVAEFDRIRECLQSLNYAAVTLPRVATAERVAFVLNEIAHA